MRNKLCKGLMVIWIIIIPMLFSCASTQQKQSESKDGKTYELLGWRYFLRGDYEKAIYYYTKWIGMDPNDPEPYSWRATVYNVTGRYDRAISDITKAIEMNPNKGILYSNRAITFCLKEQYDLAILDCDKAIEIDPKAVEQKCCIKAYLNCGISHANKGEYDLAISDFSKAIHINPKYGEVFYNRGRSYYFNKEYDKSWDDIKKAQVLDYKVPPEFLDDLRRASGREK